MSSSQTTQPRIQLVKCNAAARLLIAANYDPFDKYYTECRCGVWVGSTVLTEWEMALRGGGVRTRDFKAKVVTLEKDGFRVGFEDPRDKNLSITCKVATIRYARTMSAGFAGETSQVVFLDKCHFFDLKRRDIIFYSLYNPDASSKESAAPLPIDPLERLERAITADPDDLVRKLAERQRLYNQVTMVMHALDGKRQAEENPHRTRSKKQQLVVEDPDQDLFDFPSVKASDTHLSASALEKRKEAQEKIRKILHGQQ